MSSAKVFRTRTFGEVEVFWIFSFILSLHAAEMPADYASCIEGITPAPGAAPPAVVFSPVEPVDLPKTEGEGDLGKFKTALERQIESCQRQDLTMTFQVGKRVLSRYEWCIQANQKLLSLIPSSKTFNELMQKAKTELSWYRSSGFGESKEVLFSGYHTPAFDLSLTKKGDFKFPIYKSKRLEIAYAKSQLDIFILQNAGGGIGFIEMPNKTKKRIVLVFDSQSSLPYPKIDQMSKCLNLPEDERNLRGLQKFFAGNPKLLIPALKFQRNSVFFRREESGPMSAVNIPLTAVHSMAIERKSVPIGVPMFFKTKIVEKDYASLALAQDAGGPRVAPGKVALYWGEGSEADLTAAKMNEPGVFYIGVPKELSED